MGGSLCFPTPLPSLLDSSCHGRAEMSMQGTRLAQGPAAVWSPQGFGEDRDIMSQPTSGCQRSQAQPSWSWEQPCGTK